MVRRVMVGPRREQTAIELASPGVPDREEIDCKWQQQTQSIVGRWESVPEGRGE